MDEVILCLEDVGKRYKGAMALDGVDLELRRGETHALVGGNKSGKSTLAGIVAGAVKPDRGRMKVHGHSVYYEGHIDALGDGIALVAQDVSLVLQMNIAENIWIGRETEFGKAGFISPKARDRATAELLAEYGIFLPPGQKVQDLSIAQMRAVELMRALSYKPEVLVLDELTAGLNREDTAFLREIIKKLQTTGLSILLVSHAPEEIYGLADRITVLRDGRGQGSFEKKDLPPENLIRLAAGEEPLQSYPVQQRQPGAPVLECKDLRSDYGARGAGFTVRAGEIVCLYGLFGAGRMQTLRALFGLDKKTGGSVMLDGVPVDMGSPSKTVRQGVAMILPGKARLGLLRGISTRWNTQRGYVAGGRSPFKGFSLDLERIDASKAGSVAARIHDLSDSGRKRVLMGRSMGKKPRLLISCEPTQGIAASIRKEVYMHLDKIAAEGVAVLLSTWDLDEAMGMGDRVLVLRDGLVAAEFSRQEASREKILEAAFGF